MDGHGDPALLRHDYRRQFRRFAANATRPAPVGPWLNRGRGLSYVPVQRTGTGANAVSTSEYGGIVLGGIRHYTAAVEAASMAPLDPASRTMLRAYARRQLFGEWTHAGYLNWDTGLGFLR